MSDPQTDSCSFCSKIIKESFCEDCADVLFPALDSILKKQTNKQDPLEGIDNLVFQGGGFRAVSYFGALEKLGDEFLLKVKRFAGTSAGALCALYLGLGKDLTEIEELVFPENFLHLLDDGLIIQVRWDNEKLDLPSKQIYLAMTNYLSKKGDDLKEKDTITGIIYNIIYYLSAKKGYAWHVYLGYSAVRKFISSLLEKIIPPSKKPDGFEQIVNDAYDSAMKKDSSWFPYIPKVKKELAEKNLEDEAILHYTVVEFFITCYFSEEKEYSAGIFEGFNIKNKMIIDPIAKSLQAKGVEKYKELAQEVTFKELADLGCKPIYVTAVNTSTLQTEVFSVDHTPHAVVADAVRASLSVPVFFKADNIREKLPGQEPSPRLIYSSPSEAKPIVYVDGGVLDNYPLWIFDDLKYITGNDLANWKPERKLGMKNPKTLGFRVLSKERIDYYKAPSYDDEQRKMKTAITPNQFKSYSDMVQLLYQSLFTFGLQENEYVQFGEAPRTVYIDDKDVRTLEFEVYSIPLQDLKKAGQDGVKDFLTRAKNSFYGEIGARPIQSV